MNKLDSELVLGELLRAGYQPVDNEFEADVILFNTCSVREHAEERVYSHLGALKKIKKNRPEVIIGLLGCLAQKDKNKALKRVPHLDLVCGPHRYKILPELIRKIAEEHRPVIETSQSGLENDGAYFRNLEARQNSFQNYVRVMQGCNNYCSYCIVPSVRGTVRSRPLPDIAAETKMLVDNGCLEITLLGQNITAYRSEKNTLADVLKELSKINGLARLRFITSHPAYVTQELLETIRDNDKICPYLHMPAQSGSNRILKAMKRGYTAEIYLDLIRQAREIVPDLGIASDFIVGFPGETESDFEATVNLIREADFQNCFIFKYSPRPGTKAAELAETVPEAIKKERNNLLLKIQSEISARHNQKLVGKTDDVLVEGGGKNNHPGGRAGSGKQTGRTVHNQIVFFESPNDLTGQLVKVRITSATSLSLQGRLMANGREN